MCVYMCVGRRISRVTCSNVSFSPLFSPPQPPSVSILIRRAVIAFIRVLLQACTSLYFFLSFFLSFYCYYHHPAEILWFALYSPLCAAVYARELFAEARVCRRRVSRKLIIDPP